MCSVGFGWGERRSERGKREGGIATVGEKGGLEGRLNSFLDGRLWFVNDPGEI
jgi:hypothetical protein